MKKIFITVGLLFSLTLHAEEQIISLKQDISSESNLDDDDKFYSKYNNQQGVYDPLESINRKTHQFNKALDTAAIKPITEAYVEITPSFLRKGVNNIFNYIKGPYNIINYSLQGNGMLAGDAMARFLINTFGFGVLDFASEANIPLQNTTFGETLGVWGVGEGPYIVLPLLGGATLRDTSANIAVDMQVSPESNLNEQEKLVTTSLKVIDTRSQLLPLDKVFEESSLDEYSFIKNAQIQQKRNKIKELSTNED